MKEPIVIYFATPNPFEQKEHQGYKERYEYLLALAKKRGIDLRLVFEPHNYQGGKFLAYWQFEKGQLVKKEETFSAKIVYVKDRDIGITFPQRVNSPELEEICRDKYKTAQLFPEYVKKTVLITPETLAILDQLQTSRVVIKPRFGSEGDDINIVKKIEVTKELVAKDEYVAQEFVDSSNDEDGLIKERHELRIFMFNGELGVGFLKIPAEGSLLSNIAQGAKAKQITLDEIPKSVYALAKSVDAHFIKIKSRIYSVDIMFEHNKPWIIELNDMPGLSEAELQPLTDTYMNKILDVLSEE